MKKFLILSIISLALLVVIPVSVLAYTNATETRYTSSLYMAPNTILTGQTYTYYQPNYKISLRPIDFYNHNYCTIYIDLYRDDGFWGKTFLSGGLEGMDSLNTTYIFERGNHGACDAFYYFELDSGGIQANPVYLYSYQ